MAKNINVMPSSQTKLSFAFHLETFSAGLHMKRLIIQLSKGGDTLGLCTSINKKNHIKYSHNWSSAQKKQTIHQTFCLKIKIHEVPPTASLGMTFNITRIGYSFFSKFTSFYKNLFLQTYLVFLYF